MAKAKRKPQYEMPEMIPDTSQNVARHPADAPAERRVEASERREDGDEVEARTGVRPR